MRAQPRSKKALVDVGAPLITDGEAAKAVEPCQCRLDDPAMPAQSFAAIDAPSGNAGREGAFSAFAPAVGMVLGLVGVECVRADCADVHDRGAPLARHPEWVPASCCRAGWPGSAAPRAVCPAGRPQDGASNPVWPTILGVRACFGTPPFSPQRQRCRGMRDSRPIVRIRKALQKNAVKPGPDTGCLPATQPAAYRSCRSQTHVAASPRE